MSTAVSTSRANHRPSKEKAVKGTQATQNTKSEGPQQKMQPTPEQLRLAQMISSDVADETVKQVMELTGRSEDEAALALHDCQNDADRAVNLLLEGGELTQGEWRESGKKKKRSTTNTPIQKTEPTTNHVMDGKNVYKSENNQGDRSRERESGDKMDSFGSRRGRRGGQPPRFSRGRGRDRGDFPKTDTFRDNADNADNQEESGGFGNDRVFGNDRTFGNDRGFSNDRSFGNDRGFGSDRGFGNRGFGNDRGFRSRGRGRGGQTRRGRGTGRGGGGQKFEREPHFDKGPQIDTWTNETAAKAQKEESEDWGDDSWTGNLSESKVFTASSHQPSQNAEDPSIMTDDTNALPQRIDLGALLHKSVSADANAEAQFISQYNQQATDSIKSTIGIGSAPRLNHSSPSAQAPNVNPLATNQSLQQTSRITGFQPMAVPQQIVPQSNLQQQRPKSQRSKLPPPSKIPATPVEMPGNMTGSLDVQFGSTLEFGSDSSPFSFGGCEQPSASSGYNSTSSSTSSSHVNHLNTGVPVVDSPLGSSLLSATSQNSTALGGAMDTVSARSSVFQNSSFVSSPKKDVTSTLEQSLGSSERIPYPHSQPERKTSPLMGGSPRSAQTLDQVSSLSMNKSDGDSLGKFAQTQNSFPYQAHKMASMSVCQSYPTSTTQTGQYQSQFTNSQSQYHSSSQFPTTSANQFSSGQSQYPSGQSQFQSVPNQFQSTQSSYQSGQNHYSTGQNQFQSGQNQYQSGQNQFQSGSNQFPSGQSSQFQSNSSQFGHPSYQSGSSFQSQSSFSSSSTSNPSSLYPTSTPATQTTSSYHHQRDSQTSVTQSNSSAFSRENQSNSSYPRESQSNSSYSRDSQSSAFPRESQLNLSSSGSPPGQQSFNTSSHQPSVPTSHLPSNKLTDGLSKLSVKESSLDSSQSSSSSQYDHATSSASLTTTSTTVTTTGSSTSGVATTITSATSASFTSSTTTRSTASTNKLTSMPPGMPAVLGAQYIMGQGTIPYVGLPQPLFTSYEELQLLQQQSPLPNNYYDITGFPLPSTLTGRDQPNIGTLPYSVAGSDNKLSRVEAQSPVPSTQQTSQSTHQQQQPFINLPYGYYYPSMFPAGGLQYHTMFPMPPVTNTGHAANSTNVQYQKSYATHGYGSGKGYDELSPGVPQDISKMYPVLSQTQTKGTAGTSSVASTGSADLSGYGKSHAQGFDKQGFHGTPPPFALPLTNPSPAAQLGAAPTPYGTPYVSMLAAPHSQMLHHQLQQDSVARATQQTSGQAKTAGSKSYSAPAYWPS